MATIISPVDALMLLVQEEVAETPLDFYPMVSRLQKRTISQRQIKWNANAAGATATGEATSVDVTTFSDDDYVPATLAIGENRVRHSFSIQKELISEARTAGRGALRDLFAKDIQSGIRVCLEKLQTDIYTGTGTAAQGGVVGLDTAITATTYANISGTTYTAWTSFVNTNGTARPLTRALLQAMEVGIYRKGGNFTAIYTTPELCSTYKDLFAGQTNIQPSPTPSGVADIGYTGLSYAGRPIIQDPYAPANKLYFVDERDLYLYSFAQNNTESRQGLEFAIAALPSSNPDAERYVVYIKPQLQVFNRAKAAALLNNVQ